MLLAVWLLAGCAMLSDAIKLQEYELGGDTIATVNAVVGERNVTGVSTSQSGESITKTYTYESSSVTEDLTAYLTKLVNSDGFIAIEADIDLEIVPGVAKVAAESPSDPGKIIIMQIDYTDTGYTVDITRMSGTLNTY